MDVTTLISIFIAVLTAVCAIFGLIIQRKTEKIKIIESQLSEKNIWLMLTWSVCFIIY